MSLPPKESASASGNFSLPILEICDASCGGKKKLLTLRAPRLGCAIKSPMLDAGLRGGATGSSMSSCSLSSVGWLATASLPCEREAPDDALRHAPVLFQWRY